MATMSVTGNIVNVHNVEQSQTDTIANAGNGTSAPQLSGMSESIVPLSASSRFVVMAQGGMQYAEAARGESSAWITYQIGTGTETVLKSTGPLGEETDATRPKLCWTAIGYLAPETIEQITFRVRANGRDVLNNAKSVDWLAAASMIIMEFDL
jgi:hypothetical protein